MRTLRTCLGLSTMLLTPLATTGCNPFAMGLGTPLPVPPWVPEYAEERLTCRSDHDTPILPPIPAGYRPQCEDLPDRSTILRAMPRITRGIPWIYEEFREDYDFTIEPLV